MRPIALALAAACLLAGAVVCDPAATDPTRKSAAVAVPAGGAPAPAGGGGKAKDAEIAMCEAGSTLYWPSVEVIITSHGSRASNCMVRIGFLDAGGARIGGGMAATDGLVPGRRGVQKVQGGAGVRDGLSCRVVDVARCAAPWCRGA